LDIFGIDPVKMQKTPSLPGALLKGKCPRCRRGNIFSNPATSLSRFNRMNETCPHCGVRLEPEPGFYQGAMYVSYGFTVLVFGIVSAILYYFGNPSAWVYVWSTIATMIVLVPWNYRYSRIIYLYSFGGLKFDPSQSK
jgi:uncharacterized protein (DUF983 family)